jgi:hypothetical protein
VDKKLLDELKMTQEEWDAFQKAYAERLKQKAAEANGPAGAADRQRGAGTGRSAANTGAKRVEGGKDKAGTLERGGATLPPPAYRDGYRGFTENLSKSPQGKKDGK